MSPLEHVGARLIELGTKLQDLAVRQRELDTEASALLAEVKALGIPGATVPRSQLRGPDEPRRLEASGPSSLGRKAPMAYRVLEQLARGGDGQTIVEVAHAIQISPSQVRHALVEQGRKYGRAHRVGRGQWAISQAGRVLLAKERAIASAEGGSPVGGVDLELDL